MSIIIGDDSKVGVATEKVVLNEVDDSGMWESQRPLLNTFVIVYAYDFLPNYIWEKSIYEVMGD